MDVVPTWTVLLPGYVMLKMSLVFLNSETGMMHALLFIHHFLAALGPGCGSLPSLWGTGSGVSARGLCRIDQAPAGLTPGLRLGEQKPQYVCAFAFCVHGCVCACKDREAWRAAARGIANCRTQLNSTECICACTWVRYPFLPPLLDSPSQNPLWPGALTTFSGVSLQIAKGSLRTSSCWVRLWTEKPSSGSLSGRWFLEGSSMATAGLSRPRAPGEVTAPAEHLVSPGVWGQFIG